MLALLGESGLKKPDNLMLSNLARFSSRIYYGIKKTVIPSMVIDSDPEYRDNIRMARPRKEKDALMRFPLRIMLTADQKELIAEAARLDGVDMAAWARPVLLGTARRHVAKRDLRKKRSKNAIKE